MSQLYVSSRRKAIPGWKIALLVVPFAATAVAAQPVLDCDVARQSSIDPASEVEQFSFSAVNGEIVSISIEEDAASLTSFQPYWRLLTSSGQQASDCGTLSQGNQRNCGPLSASGSPYRVQVQDFSNDAVGDYLIHLQRLTSGQTCDREPIQCDAPIESSITPLGDTDLYTFDVESGEIVAITIEEVPTASADLQAYWRLLTGSGETASDCGSFNQGAHRDCGPLSASGIPYQIEIKDLFGDEIGDHVLHLQRLTLEESCDFTRLTCGAPKTGSIDQLGDGDLFPVCVQEGTILTISVDEEPGSPSEFQAYWRLLAQSGQPASDCGTFTLSDERDCGPLSAASGPYQIEVNDLVDDSTGTYTVTVTPMSGQCADCPFFEIFSDGFESGDTTAWSASKP